MKGKLSVYGYRLSSWLKHWLTSRHTGGYGVHSPLLFELISHVMTDQNAYYCFSRIEKQRQRLLSCDDLIYVHDFGTGSSGERRISRVAATSLKQRQEAQLLFRLAVMMKAKEIVELGTSLGITTAYLASVGSDVSVTTFDGAEQLTRVAKNMWSTLGLKNITPVNGDIDMTLPTFQPGAGRIDLAFVDANHTGEATLRYFDCLAKWGTENSVFVVDDIHSSADMDSAWHAIQQRNNVTATIDVYSMGLVFFDKHLEKRDYKVRL